MTLTLFAIPSLRDLRARLDVSRSLRTLFACSKKRVQIYLIRILHLTEASSRILAEREGFEPSVRIATYTHFPSVRLRPLGHLSCPESIQGLGRGDSIDICIFLCYFHLINHYLRWLRCAWRKLSIFTIDMLLYRVWLFVHKICE